MGKSYYVGSYREDGLNESNRGWIVGTFKADEPRRNNDVEIKYWEFPAGPTTHEAKTSAIIECTFVLSGKVKGMIDDEEIILEAGNYVVIRPGTPNNLVAEIIEDACGLTVKAPSDPTAKKALQR